MPSYKGWPKAFLHALPDEAATLAMGRLAANERQLVIVDFAEPTEAMICASWAPRMAMSGGPGRWLRDRSNQQVRIWLLRASISTRCSRALFGCSSSASWARYGQRWCQRRRRTGTNPLDGVVPAVDIDAVGDKVAVPGSDIGVSIFNVSADH